MSQFLRSKPCCKTAFKGNRHLKWSTFTSRLRGRHPYRTILYKSCGDPFIGKTFTDLGEDATQLIDEFRPHGLPSFIVFIKRYKSLENVIVFGKQFLILVYNKLIVMYFEFAALSGLTNRERRAVLDMTESIDRAGMAIEQGDQPGIVKALQDLRSQSVLIPPPARSRRIRFRGRRQPSQPRRTVPRPL